MRFFILFILFCMGSLAPPAQAVEGPAVAGPIGGTDMRSALLPPPGVYGGTIGVTAGTLDFVDADGDTIPALRDAHLTRNLVGPFVFYVPDIKIGGGAIGFGAILPVGSSCGHLFVGESDRCTNAVGDLYGEFNWSRSFVTVRPSAYSGAYPILEGLTVLLGLGVVFPTGEFNSSHPTEQAISIGTNIWDFAPTAAFTYTTAPIFVEGTEVSAKIYWNNYLENSETHHRTGELINIDFAVTERIGRWQVGLAGFFATQIADDRVFGVPIPPDGAQAETLQLGGVVNYDMPESASSVKLKATTSVYSENTVYSWGVALGWVKKF